MRPIVRTGAAASASGCWSTPGASGLGLSQPAPSRQGQQPPRPSPTVRAIAARCKSAPVLRSAAFVACRAPCADVSANGRSNGTSAHFPGYLLLPPVARLVLPTRRAVRAGTSNNRKKHGYCLLSTPFGGKARKRYAMCARTHSPIAIIWHGTREKWSGWSGAPSAADSIFLTRSSQLAVGAHVEFADLLEKRRARHAKQLCSLFDAAASPREHRSDMVPLGPAADRVQG